MKRKKDKSVTGKRTGEENVEQWMEGYQDDQKREGEK